MITPDGTHLISRSRHDYVTHIDKNGHEYMVDGGLDYLRRSVNSDAPAKDTSLYTDDSHELLREELVWGTYGKEPDCHALEYIKIKDLNKLHIQAIIDGKHGSEIYRKVMSDELEYRLHGGCKSKSEFKRLEVQRGKSVPNI